MIDSILALLGTYTQLQGDGIASINWPWLVGAAFFLLCIWFLFKLVLRLIGGKNG